MEPLIADDEGHAEENRIDESPLSTEGVEDDDRGSVLLGRWYQTIHRVQRISLVAAPMVAGLAVLVVGWWISQLGGLSTRLPGQAKLIFNWHPLLMILSFLFMTVARLSFRFSQGPVVISRTVAKWGHGFCWAIAAICMVLGLMAVFHSHNDPTSGYIANLYSLHSWIGLFMVILYFGQLLAGFGAFGMPATAALGLSPTLKFCFLQIHTFLGPIIYHGILLTLLLGIQEKEGFVGCSYKVDQADVRPWQHWQEIPAVCRISHGLGLLLVTTGALTGIATHPWERSDHRRQR